NPMGVHHAWGRALKDVLQRYKALRGFDERYQNGYDCQGLWVEVEVEKELGLNSKREIEDYGLAEFAERCKERVAKYVGVMTQQSQRLGQWMDWGNDYLTFSDTNIEYIWRFLAETDRRGWLYKGHRSTQWCPRCGTSLSQHEQAGEENHVEMEHPSLYVRFPLKEREGESLIVWTTTPWTLPANVAAAVKPDAEYVLHEDDGGWRLDFGDGVEGRRLKGEELVWLDAGIVPLSTLGWQNPEWIEHGYATGAAVGLSGADLPDHAYWEEWFPADWISESREQIRLWFYSISFMSMTLVGRLPYRAVLAYERVRDEHGREMHKSTGNAIEANEAF